MIRNPLFHVVLLSACFICAPAFAEDPATDERGPLLTDRPGANDTSRTVGKKTFQAEIGVDGTFVPDGDQTHLFPLKLKQGISENFEFHVETNTYEIVPNGESGLSAPEVGTKWHLGHDPDGDMSIGLSTGVIIPILDSQSLVFSSSIASEFTLTQTMSLGITVGADVSLSPFDGNNSSANFALGLSRSWNDQFGSFIDVFGTTTLSGELSMGSNLGVTYLITPNLQIDAYARQGYVNRSDFGAGAGVSFRL